MGWGRLSGVDFRCPSCVLFDCSSRDDARQCDNFAIHPEPKRDVASFGHSSISSTGQWVNSRFFNSLQPLQIRTINQTTNKRQAPL
jgi:hypothetical protein